MLYCYDLNIKNFDSVYFQNYDFGDLGKYKENIHTMKQSLRHGFLEGIKWTIEITTTEEYCIRKILHDQRKNSKDELRKIMTSDYIPEYFIYREARESDYLYFIKALTHVKNNVPKELPIKLKNKILLIYSLGLWLGLTYGVNKIKLLLDGEKAVMVKNHKGIRTYLKEIKKYVNYINKQELKNEF